MVVAAAPLANPKHKINTCTRSDKISFFFAHQDDNHVNSKPKTLTSHAHRSKMCYFQVLMLK